MLKLVLFVAACVAAVAAIAPLTHTDTDRVIPDNYIVVLKNVASASQRASHLKRVRAFATLTHEYSIGNSFFGYAAVLKNETLAVVRNMPEVDYVSADQVVSLTQECVTQNNVPSWGLDRISDISPEPDNVYPYNSQAGFGTDSYIIDTGILTTHVDFGGRARFGINTVGDNNNNDCNGHGTHVAGTVGGTLYGVAKRTALIAVKVLNCGGSGSFAGVISGVNWVATSHGASGRPSTANMSLGGGLFAALNAAVTAAVGAGVVFVVAAGNEQQSACNVSPASTPEAITVGSTLLDNQFGSVRDARSSFSNFGTCVNVFAPGSSIVSAWYTSNTASATLSGTSMASPHVCGVAAMFLGVNPTWSPAQVGNAITSSSTQNIIDLVCPTNPACAQSPNLMVHHTC